MTNERRCDQCGIREAEYVRASSVDELSRAEAYCLECLRDYGEDLDEFREIR